MKELQFSDLAQLLSMGGLTRVFVAIMVIIFMATLVALAYHYMNYRSRFKAINELIEGQSKEHLAINRQDILERAMGHRRLEVGKLWREFDESLVFSGDRAKLFNTLDAEHFFNTKTLATGLTESRLLAAAPSFLVAIGVLGTFVGLSLGLADLHLQGDLEQLQKDMEKMISGASTAFSTSIFGVFLSLLVNFGEKSLEHRVRRAVHSLQQKIDFLYPRIPAEQSLVEIADATQSASVSLQELHERIGDRLQESIEGISQAMQEAVTDALNKVMAPALESLAQRASDQSTVVLEQLVGQFMEKFGEAGREQGAAMSKVAQDVTTAVDGMRSQLDRVFESIEASRADSESRIGELNNAAAAREKALQDQFNDSIKSISEVFREQADLTASQDVERYEGLNTLVAQIGVQQDEMLKSLNEATLNTVKANNQLSEDIAPLAKKVSEAAALMAESSESLKISSRELGELGRQARMASEALAQSIMTTSETMDGMADASKEVADKISMQLGLMRGIHDQLSDVAESLQESAKTARSGFEEMSETQKVFLDGVKSEFSKLAKSLADEVSTIERQASNWLKEYHSSVSDQVSDRMQKWDEVSRKYADQMLGIVEAISGVVDEIEAKVR